MTDNEEQDDVEWEAGYEQGMLDAVLTTPPWLRRFFWWDKASLTFPRKILYLGTDECCNNTVGVRLWGGVLFIRTGRRVWHVKGKACQRCQTMEHTSPWRMER